MILMYICSLHPIFSYFSLDFYMYVITAKVSALPFQLYTLDLPSQILVDIAISFDSRTIDTTGRL